jgi:hypothetical protein
MSELKNKTDIELVVMKVDMEQAMYQLQQQMKIVEVELMERVKNEKEKNHEKK